jgi:hypothetical protein
VLHRSVAQLFPFNFWSTVVITFPAGRHSERSEESQSFLSTITEPTSQRVSLRST